MQGKKKRDTAARDAEKQLEADKQPESNQLDGADIAAGDMPLDDDNTGPTDLLSGKDEDIIF